MYLSIISSLEMQIRPIKTKVYYKPAYFVWKEISHKPLKVAAAETFFPKCVYRW